METSYWSQHFSCSIKSAWLTSCFIVLLYSRWVQSADYWAIGTNELCVPLTISLSLITINSTYLVSLWTEGLRTDLLDRRRPPADTCRPLIWSDLSSSPSPPPRSHALSSVQPEHREAERQAVSAASPLSSRASYGTKCLSFRYKKKKKLQRQTKNCFVRTVSSN